jgi:hypothetical protein
MRTHDQMQIKNTSLKGVEFVEKLLNETRSGVRPIVATDEAHLSIAKELGTRSAIYETVGQCFADRRILPFSEIVPVNGT